MKTLLILVVMLLCVGCQETFDATPDPSGPSGGAQGFTTGLRLHVRYFEGFDGSTQRIGFYDSLRQENCEVGLAGDGKFRCLARAGVVVNHYFADAGCTVPLGIASCPSTSPYVAAFSSDGTCGPARERLFAVGAAHTGVVYRLDGSCIAAELPAGYSAFAIGSEVDPSQFVEMVEKRE